jgi:hypothetical protein
MVVKYFMVCNFTGMMENGNDGMMGSDALLGE